MSKVWLITGAGSGIGSGIAKAALRAGDRVVATGRNLGQVRNALSDVASERPLVKISRMTNPPKQSHAGKDAVAGIRPRSGGPPARVHSLRGTFKVHRRNLLTPVQSKGSP